jgi:hypothetical protein
MEEATSATYNSSSPVNIASIYEATLSGFIHVPFISDECQIGNSTSKSFGLGEIPSFIIKGCFYILALLVKYIVM